MNKSEYGVLQKRAKEIWNSALPTSDEVIEYCRAISYKIKSSGNAKLEAGKYWRRISKRFLSSNNHAYPFEIHKEARRLIYAGIRQHETPIAWAKRKRTRPSGFRRINTKHDFQSYSEFQKYSATHRLEFWRDSIAALKICFTKQPDALAASLDSKSPSWLSGALMNIAESCFNAPARRKAIVYHRLNGEKEIWTYARLLREARAAAAGLRELGLGKGDAVAMYMPMTPMCVACYLGIIYAGCVAVSIADSLAPPEIARRIAISGAKATITQDGVYRGEKFLPLYNKICAADAPIAIVIACNDKLSVPLRKHDFSWDKFRRDSDINPEPCKPTDAITILFSSGTTGDPKAIPWSHSTPIKCASDAMIHQDIFHTDIVAWPTNIGWMMGPWLIFATLINQATIALAEVAPNTKDFCKFVDNCGATILGVVPSLVKKWRETDAAEGCDWSKIRVLTSTGEASNYDDYHWLMAQANYAPIIEYCGGTEIGGAYITSTLDAPSIPAHFTTPAAGLDFVIADENGAAQKIGEVFLLPHSIGLSTTLLNSDHDAAYFDNTPDISTETITASNVYLQESAQFVQGKPLIRRHGDAIEVSEGIYGAYFSAHGRVDDTMNLGGIKVSSIELESALLSVSGVIESAAVAVAQEEGGPEQLVVFAVLANDGDIPELKALMQNAISTKLNPLFRIYDVVVIDSLPRTASNKVMRRALRSNYANMKRK